MSDNHNKNSMPDASLNDLDWHINAVLFLVIIMVFNQMIHGCASSSREERIKHSIDNIQCVCEESK